MTLVFVRSHTHNLTWQHFAQEEAKTSHAAAKQLLQVIVFLNLASRTGTAGAGAGAGAEADFLAASWFAT